MDRVYMDGAGKKIYPFIIKGRGFEVTVMDMRDVYNLCPTKNSAFGWWNQKRLKDRLYKI